MGWDDDAFGDDPFGDPSADCFGHTVEDVDPFQGNDSFDGDKEWMTFNGEDDDDDDDDDENDQDEGGRRKKSSSSGNKKSSSSGKPMRRKKTKSSGGGDHGDDRHRSSRKSASSSSSGRREKPSGHRKSSGSERSPVRRGSVGAPLASAKPRRHTPRSNSAGAMDKFIQDDGDQDDDPFNIGQSSSSPSRKKKASVDDGFGDFEAFDTTNNPFASSSQTTSKVARAQSKVTSGKDGRIQRMTSTEQRNRIKHSESRRSAVKDSLFSSLGDIDDDDDHNIGLSAFLTENKPKARRRGSASGDASVQSAPAADREHHRQVRRGRRASSSQARAFDDDYEPAASPTGRPKSRRFGGSTASKSMRRLPSSGGGVRRSNSAASSASSVGDGVKSLKVDLSELAKQGHLEVVDGKMRLVVDVESLGR